MLRISQYTATAILILYYWIQPIISQLFFLKVNFEKALIFCSVAQVCLSPLHHTSSQLLTISWLISKKYLLFLLTLQHQFLRKTRWKAHSDKAGKGTFPQLQCKLATAYLCDHRINLFFSINFYGSRSLATNKPRGLNIFYWSHSLRIQVLPPPSVKTYAESMFILPVTTEYYSCG